MLVERPQPAGEESAIQICDFSLWYGQTQALREISLDVPRNQVTAFIGPSGCGKSTLLRSFNRLNDLIDGVRTTGKVRLYGRNVYDSAIDTNQLRARVGLVFQRPNPFPRSIFDNVAYGARLQGIRRRSQLEPLVEGALRSAALWDEVKDRLRASALALSGGQQQRLCIARAIAVEPEVILLDEPCSSLDPIASARIEDLIEDLKRRYTIVIVTHNLQQAARISDRTAFLYLGELVEMGATEQLFLNPEVERTRDYVTGRFG